MAVSSLHSAGLASCGLKLASQLCAGGGCVLSAGIPSTMLTTLSTTSLMAGSAAGETGSRKGRSPFVPAVTGSAVEFAGCI